MGQLVDISGVLRRGLRPDSRANRNSDGLLTCTSLKPTDFGLREYEDVTDPIDSSEYTANSITVGHPFPQLFRGREVTLLVDETAVYTVDEADWSLTPLTVYDFGTGDTATILSNSGSPWQFLDMGPYWMLFNGYSTIMYTGHNIAGLSSRPYQYITGAGLATTFTGCNYRGQLLLGGMPAWDSNWDTNWAAWATKWVTTYGNSVTDPGRNWVWWSAIGGGNEMDLYDYTEAEDGDHSVTKGGQGTRYGSSEPIFRFYAMRQDSNAMPMEWQGDLMSLLPMRDFVVAYGENGISALVPHQSPFPTYGLETLLRIGLASRGAAGGNHRGHCAITIDGDLWYIGPDMKTQRLGYREIFSPLLGEEFTISLDERENEFYISAQSASYILTQKGLARAPEAVTNLFHAEGGILGTPEADSGVTGFTVETDAFDFGSRKTKTIVAVHLGIWRESAVGDEVITVTVYARDTWTDAWESRSEVTVDGRGVSKSMRVGGVDFKIKVTSATRTNIHLDSIHVEFVEGDKFDFRGAYT